MKNIDRLEDFVKANREEFDNLDPSPKVWGKIKGDVIINIKTGFQSYFLRIAAVIAIAAVSIILINNTLHKNNRIGNSSDPEVNELLDTEKYYAQKVNGRLKEIRKCYATFPDIKDEVETDLNELELMYNSLKNDLKDNISNKSVIEAMIENNRNRLELVDSVLEQVEC